MSIISQQKNEKGQVVYAKYSDGYEEWYNDDSGDLIHRKEPDGYEEWYDAMGVTTRIKFSDGTIQGYDGSKINHLQYANGNEYKFDEMGNLLYRKRGVGGREYEYNAQGNLIREINSHRNIERRYDGVGNMIYIKYDIH